MFGKKFQDINLIKKQPFKFEKSNLEIKEIFNEPNYSFIIVRSKKKQILKMPVKSFFFITEEEFKKNLKIIYSGKDYLSLCEKKNYFIFFNKNILLNDLTVIKNLKKKVSTKKIIVVPKKKYWGYICNLFNKNNSCAKEIFMKQNTQSSMEFHIKKQESYYIYEGELDIGLRYSRAKQKITKLKKNNIFTMMPGTMHMRMAKKNTIIIEMSNKDDDTDSIIVHDGKTYKFKTN